MNKFTMYCVLIGFLVAGIISNNLQLVRGGIWLGGEILLPFIGLGVGRLLTMFVKKYVKKVK